MAACTLHYHTLRFTANICALSGTLAFPVLLLLLFLQKVSICVLLDGIVVVSFIHNEVLEVNFFHN